MHSHQSRQIATDHKDLIQDIAFDFYGKRVATASLDQSVRIWNINEKNEWIFKEELKINPGLYKVAWAHPEFGSLIAIACDRVISIYEEACFGGGKNTQSWIKRATLTDARAPITDLKFAPKFLGLQLISCSQNGEVRIYECSDILHGHTWTLFHPELRTNFNSCSSCSWSTCFNLPILLALGSNEPSSNNDKLFIFEYNEANRTYSKIERLQSLIFNEPINSLAFAPSIGKLYHVLAVASKSLYVSTIKPTKEPHKYQVSTVTLDQDVSAWRVCWNTVGSILASAGDDKKVRLWKCNYIGSWKCFAEITGDSCSILVDQNFNLNELMNRSSESKNKQHQSEQKNATSVLFCSTNTANYNQNGLANMNEQNQAVRFSQNGSVNRNQSVAWH